VELSLRRWQPRHLIGTWIAYWAALAAVTLGPALAVVWRVSRPGAHGNANASLNDGVATLDITVPGGPGWTGSVGLGALALWLVGPPLLLWLLWVVTRPARATAPRPASLPGRLTPGAAAAGRALREATAAERAEGRPSRDKIPAPGGEAR
jgi:hypothetical protein